MSATTIAALSGRSAVSTLRLALVAVAVCALLALAFVVGRATSTAGHSSRSIAPASLVQHDPYSCPRRGRPC